MSGRRADHQNPTRFHGGLGVALNRRGEPDPYLDGAVEKIDFSAQSQNLGVQVNGQILSVMVQVNTAEATAAADTLDVRVGTTVIGNDIDVGTAGLVGAAVASTTAVSGELNVQLAGTDFAELDAYVIVHWIQVGTRTET